MKKRIAIIGLTGDSLFFEVDDFASIGETIKAKSLYSELGGKGFNQAVTLLKYGNDVSFLSSLGDDEVLTKASEYLDSLGANSYLKITKDSRSAVASILRNKDGENQVVVYSGNVRMLDLKDLEKFKKEIIKSNALILTNEVPLDVVSEAIRLAKENNVLVVVNNSPAISNFDLESLCDYIVINEVELKQIYNIDLHSLNYDINKLNITNLKANLIITLGKNGVIYYSNKEKKYYKPKKVDVVDTTGAGDIFIASFVHYYLQDKNVDKAIYKANELAALSTTKRYVLNAIPRL